MKIVINTKYGGFGLSETAQRRYLEYIGKNPIFEKLEDYSEYVYNYLIRG